MIQHDKCILQSLISNTFANINIKQGTSYEFPFQGQVDFGQDNQCVFRINFQDLDMLQHSPSPSVDPKMWRTSLSLIPFPLVHSPLSEKEWDRGKGEKPLVQLAP